MVVIRGPKWTKMRDSNPPALLKAIDWRARDQDAAAGRAGGLQALPHQDAGAQSADQELFS